MANALTKLLDSNEAEKRKRGIVHTPREIHGQVELWKNTRGRYGRERRKLTAFLEPLFDQSRWTIVCTGAGTSEFVGYCLEALLRKKLALPVNVISTPRIVATPEDCFVAGHKSLLLSFARSGNSPESLGAVKIADQLSSDILHLVVTCNSRGALYREIQGRADGACLVLDEKTNDRGLAMTASFSNMVVAGQMLCHLNCLEQYEAQFDNLVAAASVVLDRAADVAEEISTRGFQRAVFLGDGSNIGTAIESHLKLQEMTAGQVMCTWDTFPGLRHGPEAVINSDTLVVAYLAADGYTRQYQMDLLREIREKKIGKFLLTVAHAVPDEVKRFSDFTVEYGPRCEPVSDDLVPPAYIPVGQLLGLFASIERGLQPDSPSEAGVIHRVVEGVRVYDPQAYRSRGLLRVLAER